MASKINLMGGIIVLVLLLSSSVHAKSTSYIYGNGQRLAKVNDTGVYYYHSDHLGSTSAVTDSDGEVVEEQKILPFGEVLDGNEKYGFTGKEHDETNLQYFGARYYDSNSGRFMNSDPAKDGVNWYLYAANNPLRFIDPDGERIRVALLLNLGKERSLPGSEAAERSPTILGYKVSGKPKRAPPEFRKKFQPIVSKVVRDVEKYTGRVLTDKDFTIFLLSCPADHFLPAVKTKRPPYPNIRVMEVLKKYDKKFKEKFGGKGIGGIGGLQGEPTHPFLGSFSEPYYGKGENVFIFNVLKLKDWALKSIVFDELVHQSRYYWDKENDVTYHNDYERGNVWEEESYHLGSGYISEELIKEITDKTEKEKAKLFAEFCNEMAKAFGEGVGNE